MRNKIFLILIFALLYVQSAKASFEDISSGARMRSLAGSYTAMDNDIEAVFAQPASVATLASPELSVSYGRPFVGLSDGSEISDNLFFCGMPVGRGAGIAIGYKSAGLSDVYREETMALNLALNFADSVYVGTNFKYLRLKYGSDAYTALDPVFANSSESSGIETDAGLMVKLSKYIIVALGIRNLNGTDYGLQEKAAAPRFESLGIAYDEKSFKIVFDAYRTAGINRFASAMEKYFLKNAFCLRFGAGWGNNNYRKLTSGIGFEIKNLSLDYAWEYPLAGIENTSGTHYVTFAVKFKKTREHVKQKHEAPKDAQVDIIKESERYEEKIANDSNNEKISLLEQIKKVPENALDSGQKLSLELQDTKITDTAKQVPGKLARPKAVSKLKLSELPVRSTDAMKNKYEEIISGFLQASSTMAHSDTNLVVLATVTATTGSFTAETPKKQVIDEIKQEKILVPSDEVSAPENKNSYSNVRMTVDGKSAKTHKVTSGDTLPSLAIKYYGSKSKWLKIYEANQDNIDKGSLNVDNIIVIP